MGDKAEQIAQAFGTEDADGDISEISLRCKDMAETIDKLMSAGRYKSIALTKLEEVMFWVKAGFK